MCLCSTIVIICEPAAATSQIQVDDDVSLVFGCFWFKSSIKGLEIKGICYIYPARFLKGWFSGLLLVVESLNYNTLGKSI